MQCGLHAAILVVVLVTCAAQDDEDAATCTMKMCFDVSRCENSKKVYVHQVGSELENAPMSTAWSNMLQYFRSSKYHTDNPDDACLFVLGIDTTDRDKKSKNYVQNVEEYIKSLNASVWNGGMNHVIFNFYHGTFPDYDDHSLTFDTGEAIVARASANEKNFRFGFDIAFPLFHDDHPLKQQSAKMLNYEKPPSKYVVSFKGKRYVYGIGSSTRNLVHHLHNGRNMIMLTTCKHNNDWQTYQDDRCSVDNDEYEKWDYDKLLNESTFCLVPRGRRLGSFRFIETLRAGCIPVIVSDGWVLPYSEVIDWTEAAIIVPEREALLIPEKLMTISRGRVAQLRKKTIEIYDKYFRSVSIITEQALKIVFRRVEKMAVKK